MSLRMNLLLCSLSPFLPLFNLFVHMFPVYSGHWPFVILPGKSDNEKMTYAHTTAEKCLLCLL